MNPMTKKTKILLATLVPTGAIVVAGGITAGVLLAKQNTIQVDLTGDTGVSIKSSNLKKNTDSTIELSIPTDKSIGSLQIKVGNTELIKDADDGYTLKNSVITIKAKAMTGENITIHVTLSSNKEASIEYDIASFSAKGIYIDTDESTKTITQTTLGRTINIVFNTKNNTGGKLHVSFNGTDIKTSDKRVTFKKEATELSIELTDDDWAKITTHQSTLKVSFEYVQPKSLNVVYKDFVDDQGGYTNRKYAHLLNLKAKPMTTVTEDDDLIFAICVGANETKAKVKGQWQLKYDNNVIKTQSAVLGVGTYTIKIDDWSNIPEQAPLNLEVYFVKDADVKFCPTVSIQSMPGLGHDMYHTNSTSSSTDPGSIRLHAADNTVKGKLVVKYHEDQSIVVGKSPESIEITKTEVDVALPINWDSVTDGWGLLVTFEKDPA